LSAIYEVAMKRAVDWRFTMSKMITNAQNNKPKIVKNYCRRGICK